MAEKKLHAIMIAFSFQGHITPFTNLALKLASNGCTVTFVHTEFINHMLSKAHKNFNIDDEGDLFSDPRKSGLDIRYATICDGFPHEYDRILNFNEYWETILRDFPSRVDDLVGNLIRSNPSLVPLLIADTFYSWPSNVAKKYEILHISFWTEPALVFSIDYHLDLLIENGHFPLKGGAEDIIEYIPGVDSISTKDLMTYIQDSSDITTVTHKIVIKGFEQVKYADFVLINTVDELESETLRALNRKKPAYAIGPINFSSDFTQSVVPKSLWIESNCSEWLNSKPEGSVLYVSFGSLAETNKQQTEEIAHGLVLSEVNFIWVMRTGEHDLSDRIKSDLSHKGLLVPWCNQNVVLSSPAVGGFVTHCGWNSTLESIYCGLPMICFPFYADQTTNRKLVVDDWKIGINLCDGVSIQREEVAEKIKYLMSQETSKGLRSRIKNQKTLLHNAMDEDGSSQRNFDQFLKDLWDKVHARV